MPRPVHGNEPGHLRHAHQALAVRQHAGQERIHDILSFRARHAFDPLTGNLIGRLTHDLRLYDNAPPPPRTIASKLLSSGDVAAPDASHAIWMVQSVR